MTFALPFEQIPQVPSRRLLGHLHLIRKNPVEFLRLAQDRADLCRMRLGPTRAVVVSSPRLMHEVLVERHEDHKKSRAIAIFARGLIGQSVFSSHGTRYKKRRGFVAPAFKANVVGRYADAIVNEVDAMLLRFGSEVSIDSEMHEITLRVVAETLFHTSVASDVPAIEDALTRALQAMNGLIGQAIPLPPTYPTKHGLKLRSARRDLDRVVYRIIRERRASGRDEGDILSMLMGARDEAGEGLDDEELRDEVMALMLAGHETTASALTWAIQVIATDPVVQARLTQEVDMVLGDRTPTFADVPKLPYTLAVFKETLRMYPPVYLNGREPMVDTQLDRYAIPAGTLIFLNIYGTHRRPEVYPDPDVFRPERFLGDGEKQLPRGAYLPFGEGPRVCAGNHFALMEGQLVLARLWQRCKLIAPSGKMSDPWPSFTLRARPPVRMRVERRTQRTSQLPAKDRFALS
ncbi:cytochrome P450 [Pendulispora albinea]|uniref:Cytochrome P450 n=1 Tax=Pendulispora albinea TaxID=2741071 RepID=A0ABZ2M9K5_9BACT